MVTIKKLRDIKKKKKLRDNKYYEDVEKREPFFTVVRRQTGTATVKNSTQDPPKIKTELHYNPGIPLLGVLSKGTKTIAIAKTKDMCISTFITTLFIIARNRNSSSVHLWMNE